tara:strand:+ start:2586 stop:4985 length:2400 start_codon:yes stop_codon:yes gene_type:complete
MNNDTTQILLAIILGIVICWFVFGRNCGLSGNDGFSVGGQRCSGTRGDMGVPCFTLAKERCQRVGGCRWIEPPPPPPANSGQTQMERDCEDYLQTLIDPYGACKDVDLGGDSQDKISTPACCYAVETTGGCDVDTMPTELSTLINEEIEICTNQATDPRQSAATASPAPPAQAPAQNLIDQKKNNIFRDMKRVLKKFYNSNSTIQTDIDRLKLSTGENPYSLLKPYADACNVRFLLLENTNDKTMNKVDTNISNIIKNFRIGDPSRSETELYLGNLFRPYSKLTPELQKNLYCQNFKIGGSIDPLLKLRSIEMENFIPYQQDEIPECLGDEYDKSQNYNSITLNQLGDILQNQIINGLSGTSIYQDMSSQIIANGIMIGLDLSQGDSRLSSNPEMLYVISSLAAGHGVFNALDNTNNDEFPGDIKIYNKHSSTVKDSLDNNMEHHDLYTVIDMSGLSVFEPITTSTKTISGIDGPYYFNKYITTSVDKDSIYYMNLFWLQYYIFRIIIGTDNYLWVNAFRKIVNNKITNAGTDPDPDNYINNAGCTNSATDYLLISLVESPTFAIGLDWNQLTTNERIVQLNGNGLFLQRLGPAALDSPSSEFWILDKESFNKKYGDPNYEHLDKGRPRCSGMTWRPEFDNSPCGEQTGNCTAKIGVASERDHKGKVISWIDGYDYNTGVLCYYNNLADATTNAGSATCTGDFTHDRVSSFGHNHPIHKQTLTSTGVAGQYPYRECLLPDKLGTTTQREEVSRGDLCFSQADQTNCIKNENCQWCDEGGGLKMGDINYDCIPTRFTCNT